MFGIELGKRKGAFNVLSDAGIEMVVAAVVLAMGVYALTQVQAQLPVGPATNITSNATAGFAVFGGWFSIIATTIVIVVIISLFMLVRGAMRSSQGGSGL